MNERQRKKAKSALEKAYNTIGRQAVADACGVSVQATYKWDVCPATHVLMIEAMAEIPSSFLRPDLYPGLEIGGDA